MWTLTHTRMHWWSRKHTSTSHHQRVISSTVEQKAIQKHQTYIFMIYQLRTWSRTEKPVSHILAIWLVFLKVYGRWPYIMLAWRVRMHAKEEKCMNNSPCVWRRDDRAMGYDGGDIGSTRNGHQSPLRTTCHKRRAGYWPDLITSRTCVVWGTIHWIERETWRETSETTRSTLACGHGWAHSTRGPTHGRYQCTYRPPPIHLFWDCRVRAQASTIYGPKLIRYSIYININRYRWHI
jgi:hypothetical protein